ncbi:hypothetical protein JZO77_02855 [Enterococcus hulanensis]|uniref:Uncharacterized protein n=1 Tax=Enterococcus hulanensis TaxID=2559929 RepID=A0ABU3EUR5_9ENTE|nr:MULTISPECIES: hypothetical protein [Enterococcus]MBO0409506.1 hypothetical protein [Enterococcus hulanensis]MBO0455682.1 hypothetical protein [Enterococcus hulanensis]MDT2598617.1 hypothetical protein [Enterococcus hulanensis]MDT2607878.1 hypothetical protein [Enterococcus hulanensis]MDT2615173.1 hypothetical protein [Enterococcus hulanensis]
MYFKNDFGKAYLENEKLYVDTDVCTITIEPKENQAGKNFLRDQFKMEVSRLQMAQMVLPPKK